MKHDVSETVSAFVFREEKHLNWWPLGYTPLRTGLSKESTRSDAFLA